MTGAAAERGAREAGATLIEVLVVLAIVAVMAGIAWPFHNGLVSGWILPSTTSDLVAVLRSGRAEAVRSGRDAVVSFNLDQRTATAPGHPAQKFRSDIGITITTGRTGSHFDSSPTVRFHPDGRTSGAEILLEHRGRLTRIIVDRSSGGVRVIAQ